MLRPTDRRVSSRDPVGHLGTQLLDEGAQMPGGDVVPLPLAGEVVEDGGVEPSHPVVRVRPAHAVRHVLVRLLRRDGRSGRGRHERHRTPALAALALVAATALTGATLGTPERRQGRRPDHLHPRLHRGRGLLQPVPRLPGHLLRGVGARVRLPGRLQDDRHVAGAGAGGDLGDLGRRPDLDLPHARGRDVERRRAADRERRRLHLQPGAHREGRRRHLAQLHQDRGRRVGTRRHARWSCRSTHPARPCP